MYGTNGIISLSWKGNSLSKSGKPGIDPGLRLQSLSKGTRATNPAVIGTFSYACPWDEGLFTRSDIALPSGLRSTMRRSRPVGHWACAVTGRASVSVGLLVMNFAPNAASTGTAIINEASQRTVLKNIVRFI